MKSWISIVFIALWLVGCGQKPAPPATTAENSAPPPSPAPQATVAAGSLDDQLQRALALKSEGKPADARALLQPLAASTNASEKVLNALGDIDSQILFSLAPAPEKVDYTVESGDSLGKIAKKFGTTVELIKKSNGLARDLIRVGDRLRIYQGHFAVEVSKTANVLTVTDNGKFFKRYRVGTGQFSKTPVGEFKITSRIENPPWYRADGKTIPYGDPENILGTHWLGLNVPGYGIHGTWEPDTIGRQSSAGCIRLLNDDVAELFVMLPVDTPVIIHD
ncbi:MAG: L,D-transpeptidase family protein [Verrucomicrobiia bacterium]|jgi:lipoprotein-anchoring transpeptidase ErfK/SrfK